ncbi:hypothetical protein NE237_001592 [Protea cynaroides]|uniref:Uncharacterized protein n=1 Tax=Protea cynaroides TaxID=273540 RepID=A0A9Q0KU98_9MAGN|nr:hypothetical protein NE237_001592 [Protea cynaroides]
MMLTVVISNKELYVHVPVIPELKSLALKNMSSRMDELNDVVTPRKACLCSLERGVLFDSRSITLTGAEEVLNQERIIQNEVGWILKTAIGNWNGNSLVIGVLIRLLMQRI